MFWEKDVETMPRAELEALQLERLKWVLRYAYERVPFYKERFDKAGVNPDRVKCLSDIEYFPYTTKDDLRDNYPLGLSAVPRAELVRIHGTSGTTGRPTLIGYTKRDLDTWSNLIARLATAVGVTREDVAQMAFGYGLFTGGFGLHYGLEKIGCMVLPLSSGNTERHLYMMEDMGTTVLIATPTLSLIHIYRYNDKVFLSGFIINSLLAALLIYAGSLLDIELYYAAIVVFGVRLFQNFASIRRILLNSHQKK